MSENLSPDRKRLLYRANHRGTKEADLVIGNFASQNLAHMTDQELGEFSRLLEVPDQDLYAWATGSVDVPEHYQGPVMTKLQAFDVSGLLQGK